MNTIQMVGQAITCTNYATDRIFNFNPEPVIAAAEAFLAGGLSEIEIPQGVLDPDGKYPDKGIDKETLAKTLAGLPKETKVLGTYLGPLTLGEDNATYLEKQKQALSLFFENFPDMVYGILHPAKEVAGGTKIESVVETYAKLAEYAASQREGFQLCFHNHYDSSGETAEQVRAYLAAIEAADNPALTWGPDTGHSHGMKDEMLDVFEEYAHLIRNFFHIKARVPAFDRRHGADRYDAKRDIWSNKAEIGGGLYSGFVNVADPEIETPFKEIFRIIREKARPSGGVVRGAVEIDNPRQHPYLEVLCAALYLKNVHGLSSGLDLSNDEIIKRIFAV